MKATIEITDNRIRDLLCSALEGGSNYWYTILNNVLAPDTTLDDYKHGGKFNNGDYHPYYLILPFVEGAGLMIGDVESDPEDEDENDEAFKPTLLNHAALERGINIMSKDYPQHFSDFITENDDAATGDVFLQLCLFGELVFG